MKTLLKNIKMILQYRKMADALEAAWYVMEKHGNGQVDREIDTCKNILVSIGSLPLKN